MHLRHMFRRPKWKLEMFLDMSDSLTSIQTDTGLANAAFVPTLAHSPMLERSYDAQCASGQEMAQADGSVSGFHVGRHAVVTANQKEAGRSIIMGSQHWQAGHFLWLK